MSPFPAPVRFGARLYSPTMGRWLQEDPALYVNGPNLYQSEGSNPIGRLDPLGLAWGWLGRAASAVGNLYSDITDPQLDILIGLGKRAIDPVGGMFSDYQGISGTFQNVYNRGIDMGDNPVSAGADAAGVAGLEAAGVGGIAEGIANVDLNSGTEIGGSRQRLRRIVGGASQLVLMLGGLRKLDCPTEGEAPPSSGSADC